ncbi:MAG: ATP-binding protein [Desulfovibrionaceae bacterium]
MLDLAGYARDGVNCTLFSPRRLGKTSLIWRFQDELRKEGMTTVFVDCFKVMSVEDLAGRLAKAVYEGIHARSSLLEKGRRAALKVFSSFRPTFAPTPDGSIQVDVRPVSGLSGYELLEASMRELGELMSLETNGVHMAMDEFQDIVDLDDGKTEAILRTNIQSQPGSYLFSGSRRSVLRAMFSDPKRPFFRSSMTMDLPPLPHEALVSYIVNLYEGAGGRISTEAAASISQRTGQFPYYAQKLAHLLFGNGDALAEESVDQGYERLLEDERYAFQATLEGLTSVQLSVLVGLAHEPGAQTTSKAFTGARRVSTGGAQKAIKHLKNQDLIENAEGQGWKLVDPVFGDWLRSKFGS